MRLSNAVVSKNPLTWIRLMASLAVMVFSYLCQLPLIVLAALPWCVWLWSARPNWKERRLATFALVLVGLGWWVVKLDRVFGIRGEASHFTADSDYWYGLVKLSLYGGLTLMSLGLMLLAGVEYWGRQEAPWVVAAKSQMRTDTSHVWPPAPKPPQE